MSWRTFSGRVCAAMAICVLAWFGFVRGSRVPVLAYVDLGVHELGHMLTLPFPDVVTAVMGTGLQVLVPLGLAAYFAVRRELLGTALCLAWTGTSARDASVYIADAPTQQLELIGGEHDWAYVLGERFDALHMAGAVSLGVAVFGAAVLVAGLVLCLYGAVGGFTGPARVTPGIRAGEWRERNVSAGVGLFTPVGEAETGDGDGDGRVVVEG